MARAPSMSAYERTVEDNTTIQLCDNSNGIA